jgi:hypothetical protein
MPANERGENQNIINRGSTSNAPQSLTPNLFGLLKTRFGQTQAAPN